MSADPRWCPSGVGNSKLVRNDRFPLGTFGIWRQRGGTEDWYDGTGIVRSRVRLFLLPLVDNLANLIFFNLPNIAIYLIKVDLRDLSVQCVLFFKLVHTEVLLDLHLEQCLSLVLPHENVEVSLCREVNTLDATAR